MKWLPLGYSNNAYFHAFMEGRITQNQIRSLTTLVGNIVHTSDDIEAEITGFYKKLLGSSSSLLPFIQEEVLLKVSRLHREQ